MKRGVANQALFSQSNVYTGTSNSGGYMGVYVTKDDQPQALGTGYPKAPGYSVQRTNTCQAGGTSTQVILDAAASASTDAYKNCECRLTGGTGSGQGNRHVTAYNGTTKTCTVTPAWTTNPDATTTFVIDNRGLGAIGSGSTSYVGFALTAASTGTTAVESRGCWRYYPSAEDMDGKNIAFTFRPGSSTALSDTTSLEVTVQIETEEEERLIHTRIATLASQTSFTLERGSSDNDAYNNHICIVRDQTTWQQVAVGVVSDYAGGTRTVTLAADPGIFTMAIGDFVTIVTSPNAPSLPERTGVPGATISTAEKIDWLYMALRNRLDVTATKKTFYDDGGAAEWEKDLSDDGTTYSESEANAI